VKLIKESEDRSEKELKLIKKWADRSEKGPKLIKKSTNLIKACSSLSINQLKTIFSIFNQTPPMLPN